LLAVWRFSKRLTRGQRESLEFLWFKVPSHPTLCVALHGIEVDALETALSQAARSVRHDKPLHLSIDGKTLRGSGGVHPLARFCDALKATVGQRKAGRGHGEVTAAIELLKTLRLKVTLVTGDAMFADRHLCETIVQEGGNYVLPVKDKQPSLKRAAQAAVEKKCAGNARRNPNRSRTRRPS
jgi:predicted transposase YbfD/YdcC